MWFQHAFLVMLDSLCLQMWQKRVCQPGKVQSCLTVPACTCRTAWWGRGRGSLLLIQSQSAEGWTDHGEQFSLQGDRNDNVRYKRSGNRESIESISPFVGDCYGQKCLISLQLFKINCIVLYITMWQFFCHFLQLNCGSKWKLQNIVPIFCFLFLDFFLKFLTHTVCHANRQVSLNHFVIYFH